MSEFSWEDLLHLIDRGLVVPIVGPDVVQVEVGGKKMLLYSWLAERLAQKLGIKADLTDPNPLNAVASAFLGSPGNPDLDIVYLKLTELIEETATLPIPGPLRQLAEIRPFKLFLTTTFDPMLRRAIDEVRFNNAARAKSLTFLPKRTDDVTSDLLAKGLPIVFHLLGKADGPEYAVTDEDVLEWVASLQSDTLRPKNLFDELENRYLLIIGSTFRDWLARFFIRSAKRERLLLARRGDFMADDHVRNESALLNFFRRFSSKMRIFTTGGPIEFMDELHSRWMRLHQNGDPPPPPPPVIPGSIFISYASEDVELAMKVYELLDAEGLDVWLDHDRLGPGDAFDPKIARAIDQSAIFLPIISRSSITDQPRYFNLEWKYALAIDAKLNAGVRFIVPLVSDNTAYTEPALPVRFRELTWEHLDEKFPAPPFVKNLRDTVKRYRSRTAGQVA
jgi:hypothetical protein